MYKIWKKLIWQGKRPKLNIVPFAMAMKNEV